MTASSVTLQLALIALLGLPALVLVLWPLFRKGALAPTAAPPAATDRARELSEEKTAVLRALRELRFDRAAGHLSVEDYAALSAGYEARAAELIAELDRIGAVRSAPPPTARPREEAAGRGKGWSPVTVTAGAVLLVGFGLLLGLGVGRFTEPEQTMVPAGSRLPVPLPADSGPRAAGPAAPAEGSREGASSLSPETLAGMLRAARQSLTEGRYQEAIAAYQAILERDARNVDALTHLGLIVAIGGHADSALETLDRAIQIDAGYAPAHLYRGQVLYEMKQDYAAAIAAWERFLALAPDGGEATRVGALILEARAKQRPAR
jgi:tetratricopeptide (TPR) repeat protein